jgi:phosphatidylglycerophosphatase A
MPKALAKIITTFFFIGYLPLIPGTFGSLAGLVLVSLYGDSILYPVLTLIILFLGFVSAAKAEEIFQARDPRCVVIDEVAGMMLSLLFLPLNIKVILCGFLLFRILDALKPFPAHRLEALPGGLGIMADDIVAAFYTNIILQLVVRFASVRIS